MTKLFFLSFCIIVFTNCSRNIITGRSQIALFPESMLQEEAVTQYKSFISQNKVISQSSSKDADMVKRVGNRIAKAISAYYTKKGIKNDISNYQWEFNLVDDKQINAWCMPGGKVVVYSGLLSITKNEDALAIVMGHEITHAVVKHGNERMSQVAIAQGLQVAGNIFTQNNQQATNIFNNVFGPAAQLGVLLPNSRNQEYEADHYGLIFAAIAGYNPQEAIPFWQRMDAVNAGQTTEFLATHPSDKNRIKKIQGLMNEALSYYKPSK